MTHPDRVAVIAGASGFMGQGIREGLVDEGYEIRTIGRSDPVAWGDADAIRDAVTGADLLINLAGKSVNCRYSDANRDEILRSRIETTRELREAVAASSDPPRVWFNASTATIYRDALDRPQDEVDGEPGWGFSCDVARNWEREFFADDLPGTRRIALRTTICLGDGPATNLLFRLARFGVGGPQIDGWWFRHRRYRGIGPDPSRDGFARARTHGNQLFSWIHIDDVTRAILFLRDREDIDGPIDLATPEASTNRELMAALRRTVGMPIGLPAWRFMLEPAMWVLRTEPELVLKSRWVAPRRLLEAGFDFRFPDLEPALRDIRSR
ncbi:MAG: epimerase [Microbacterium sp.]